MTDSDTQKEKRADSADKSKKEMGNARVYVHAGPITKAAEFEQQMSKVKAISGATAGELAELSSKAKQMGATTEFTAAQAGEAMEYMAMAGWKT